MSLDDFELDERAIAIARSEGHSSRQRRREAKRERLEERTCGN
jgi:hypothetical protein